MLADIVFGDQGGVPVAQVRGEIDMSNAADVSEMLHTSIQHVAAGLVLDFAGTTYLDSAGLHFVFELGKRMRDRGQHLELVVPRGSPVAAVFGMVGVDALAGVSPTLEEAVARLREHAEGTPPLGPED